VNHLPSDDYLELQRVQQELAANRRKISELEELINEVPAIYERKFDQKLQPLVEDVRLLSERNQALREQLRHALSPAAAEAATPPATPAAPPAATEPAGAPAAAAPNPPAPAPSQPAAAPQASEELATPSPPIQPQRLGRRNRAAIWRGLPTWLARRRRRHRRASATQTAERAAWRWPSLSLPSLGWPRQTQPPRPVLLALLAAAGVGVVGGLGLQQWRVHTSGAGGTASRAAGSNAAAGGETQAGLTLQIRSSGETWLDVRNLRGASLYVGLFSGERRFPIGQGLRLNAGKPELVTIRVGDGPERGLGHPGWWVWHSFGPDGRQRVASE